MAAQQQDGGSGSNPASGGGLVTVLLPALATAAGGGGLKHVLLYDVVTRVLPGGLAAIGGFVARRLRQRARRLCDDVAKRTLQATGGAREITASVTIERNFQATGEYNDMFDAVLSTASDLPQSVHVKRTARGVFVVEATDHEIALGPPGVFFAKRTETLASDGELDRMTIEVYSYTRDVVQLRDYLTELEGAYRKSRGNQLGRQVYYFEELPVLPPMRPELGARERGEAVRMVADLCKAPPTLTFSMYALHTNKSMCNIYGAAVQRAKHRVRFFLDNPGWYAVRGIPYTLGILLHGAPGCGKTSFIKALARDTGRHVVNIRLSATTTVSQINALFYSPRLNVVRDGVSVAYDIPIDRRVIVMEDVDCLSSVVAERSDQVAARTATPHPNLFGQQLNLSVLLNILDGVLETPGRIVIMTSNEPLKLDRALVRPGRIDVCIEFERCSADDVLDMVEGICGVALGDRAVLRGRVAARAWTPAEVTKLIFEHIDNPQAALQKLARPPVDDRMGASPWAPHEPPCAPAWEDWASIPAATAAQPTLEPPPQHTAAIDSVAATHSLHPTSLAFAFNEEWERNCCCCQIPDVLGPCEAPMGGGSEGEGGDEGVPTPLGQRPHGIGGREEQEGSGEGGEQRRGGDDASLRMRSLG